MRQAMSLKGIIRHAELISFKVYDITCCGMENCPRKGNCRRYIIYQIYMHDVREGKPPHINMYDGESIDCNMYWQHEVFGL